MKNDLIPLDMDLVNVSSLNEESIKSLKLYNLVLDIKDKRLYLYRYLFGSFSKKGIENGIKVDYSSYISENEKVVLYLLQQAIKVNRNKITLSTFIRIEQNVLGYLLWIENNNKYIGDSIDSSKNTLLSYLDEYREKYNKGLIKYKPIGRVNDIINMLGIIYNTNIFYPITFDSNNEDYTYLHTNELSIEECIQRERNNTLIPFHNLILNVDGERLFIFRFVYTDYIATSNKIFVSKKSYTPYNINFARYMYEKTVTFINNGYSRKTLSNINIDTFHLLKWANNNDFKFNYSIDNAKKIFKAYTLYLKQSFREGKYKRPQHARHYAAYRMLKSIYQDHNNFILGDIKLISTFFDGETTEKSFNHEAQYQYSFYTKFFNQVTDFILNKKNYPLRLDLVSNSYWCIPGSQRYIEVGSSDSLQAFDSNSGVTKQTEEIMKQYGIVRSSAKHSVDRLNNIIKQNNIMYSRNRLELAKLAQKAFYMLFLTNTGMNDSTASTLLWSKEYEIQKDKVKFSTIKCRAKGKTVRFQIQSKFLILFKKYLTLREYLLKNNHFEHLFFEGYSATAYVSNEQFKGVYSSKINAYFSKKFDRSLPKLNSKTLRVNKITKTAEEHGLIAAADMAQNSLSTLIKHYQGESKESTGKQLTNYFQKLNSSIFNENDRMKETAIGGCASKIEYDYANNNKESFQDCKKQESCLFCEDYRLHVDKEDLQKLYSLSYIIKESRYIAKNESHFISVYGDILKRIDNIEEQVIEDKGITLSDLNSIKNDVFENEVLHPYWEHKLAMLLEIGVLK